MARASFVLVFLAFISIASCAPCVLVAKDFYVDNYGAVPDDGISDHVAIEKAFSAACSYTQDQLKQHNDDISECTMKAGSPSNEDLFTRYKTDSTYDINNEPITRFLPSKLLLARVIFGFQKSYHVNGSINFPSCNYLRVEGNQSTWLQLDRVYGNFITWNGHKHITMGDLTLDWDKSAPTFTGGVITSITSTYLEIKVSSPHPCATFVGTAARVIYPMDLTTDPQNAFPSAAYGGFYFVYPKPTSHELYYNGNWPYSMKAVNGDNCQLRLQHPTGQDLSRFPNLKVGVNLSISSWQVAALAGSTADPILYHSISITGGPGNAILGRDQSTALINVKMTRKQGMWAGIGGANGLGLQRRALILVDNVFDSAEDDWVNQASSYCALGSITDSTHVQILGRHMSYGVEGFFKPYDYVYVAHADNGMGFTPYTKVQIKEVTYDSQWRWANVVLMSSTPLPKDAAQGDVAWNGNFSLNLLAKNNVFKNSRGNGLLAKGSNMLIEGNTFLNLAYGGVSLGTDQTYWFEATPSKNVTIRNNKFTRCAIWSSNAHAIGVNGFAYTKAVHTPNGQFPPPGGVVINPPSAFYNITIEGNTIDVDYRTANNENPKEEAGLVYVGSTDRLTINNNVFQVHSALTNNLALIELCNIQHGEVGANIIKLDSGNSLTWNKTNMAVNFPASASVHGPHNFELQVFQIDRLSGCQLGYTKTLDNNRAFSN